MLRARKAAAQRRHDGAGRGRGAGGDGGILAPAEADKLLSSGSSFALTVLDPGTAPREELLYDLEQGSVAELTEDTEVEASVTVGQAPANTNKMAITRQVLIRTKDSGPRGAHVEIEVIRATVSGAPGLPGGTVEADVSPKGRLEGIKGSALGSPGFQTSIVVLPDGPIGTGGRWRLVRRTPTNPNLLHIELYTLRSRDGSTLELDVTSRQLFVGAGFKLPNGAEASVRRYEYRGGGHKTVVTHAVVPAASRETSRQVMELSTNGGDMKVDSTTTAKTSAHGVPGSR